MNIMHFEVAALCLLMVFFVSLIIRKQYRGRTNRILFGLVMTIMVTTLFDVLGGYVANYGERTYANKVWMYVLNYGYFFCHNMILPLMISYLYSSIDIWHIYLSKKYLRRIWYGVTILKFLWVAFNQLFTNVFYINDDIQYCRGDGIAMIYATNFLFVGWAFLLVIFYWKVTNKDKRIVLLCLFPIMLMGTLMQLAISNLLVEMFSMSLCLLLFMVIVRREENQIDPITGAVKYNEGIDRVSKNFMTKKPVTVILVKIVNHSNIHLYLGQENYTRFLRMCTDKFWEFSKGVSANRDIYYLEAGRYAVVFEGYVLDKAIEVANRMQDFLLQEMKVEEFEIFPYPRLCLVECPKDIPDFSTLYSLGITFHKNIPDNGGINFYSEIKDDVNFKIRNEMEEIIERGLRDGKFEMYYQPIYSVVERKYVSAEALIRLNDEKYGNIPPGMFLPIAESNGKIHEIGNFVIESVVDFIAKQKIEDMGLEYIEMNLSASQCIEADLVEKIMNLLEKKGVDPERLSLELTENAADINPVIVDQNIKELHEYGVRIALDDYGTGYSNIKRVTMLPIDQVKLDKSFVDLIDNREMWIVIQDTINMLKEMGKEILVEGVEEENVAKRFTDLDTDLFLGCELVQGFYYCKPLPAEEFVDFIKNNKRG